MQSSIVGVKAQFLAASSSWFPGNPLYRKLCEAIAADCDLLNLASSRATRGTLVYVFLGAVHFLVLRERRPCPLAAAYLRSGERSELLGVEALFRSYCMENERAIRRLVECRIAQTNDPGRAALIVAGLLKLEELLGRRDLFLVELGSSAGLNLNLDQFRLRYHVRTLSERRSAVFRLGPESSSARVPCRVIGDCSFITRAVGLPRIAGRVGVDLQPPDLSDADEVQWLEALIWPGERRRLRLFRSALRIFQNTPQVVLKGDMVALLPRISSHASTDLDLFVVQTFATSGTQPDLEMALRLTLAEASRERVVRRCAVERRGESFVLIIEVWKQGLCRESHCVGLCDPRGTKLSVGTGESDT